MNFEDLNNPELQEKLKSAKTADELVALAKEEGLELTDEQLEAVSGGDWDCRTVCSERTGCYADCPLDYYR